jgi:predicted HicB family RNase H-like nuclease
MIANTVDLDQETIQFDGKWMSRADLARAIRQLLEGGNYAISRQSSALEALNRALSEARTLTIRLPPELDEALKRAATRASHSAGMLVCEAISQQLAAVPAPVIGPAFSPVEHSAAPSDVRFEEPPAALNGVNADSAEGSSAGAARRDAPAGQAIERLWFGG